MLPVAKEWKRAIPVVFLFVMKRKNANITAGIVGIAPNTSPSWMDWEYSVFCSTDK